MTQHPSALSLITRRLQNASHSSTVWCVPIWHRVQKVCIRWFVVNLLFWDLIKSEQTLSTILFYDTSWFLGAEQLVFPHKPACGFLTASLMFYSLRLSAASHKDFSCGRIRSVRLLPPHCLLCVLPRDPHPKVERLYETDRDDHTLRVQNFSILNRHIRAFYQVRAGFLGGVLGVVREEGLSTNVQAQLRLCTCS